MRKGREENKIKEKLLGTNYVYKDLLIEFSLSINKLDPSCIHLVGIYRIYAHLHCFNLYLKWEPHYRSVFQSGSYYGEVRLGLVRLG